MKKIIKSIFIYSIIVLGLVSCEDYELEDPASSFIILKEVEDEYQEASTFNVGESVYVKNTGSGEMFTIFTGDPGHDGSSLTYTDEEGVEKINKGFNLNHPRENVFFNYSYNNPGTYVIKVIAITSFGDEGSDIKESEATKEVVIIEP